MEDRANPSTSPITGAEIVIRCLQEENVKFVFGYPGGAVLNIYDEIFKRTSSSTSWYATSRPRYTRPMRFHGRRVKSV